MHTTALAAQPVFARMRLLAGRPSRIPATQTA